MHTYRPPRANKAHLVTPIILILIFFTCIWAAKAGTLVPPFVMQLAAVICATVAIQIITRYSLTQFVYELDSENKEFKVIKILGKKNSLAASLEFDDIKHIDKKDKDYSVKKKYSESFKIYNFCNNIYPENVYCMVCKAAGESLALTIEADEEFLKLLESYINEGENLKQ